MLDNKLESITASSRNPPLEKDFFWLHLRDLPYFRALLRSVESGFYQNLDLPSPTLDLGCGDGHFARITFNRPLEVGLDPEKELLREACRNGSYRALVHARGDSMPFPDGYFASLVSNSVLEHILAIDKVLSETSRVLRSGSPFIFCVPNPRYLKELSIPAILARFGMPGLGRIYREWFRRITRVYHADPPELWITRLEQSGFALEDSWDYFAPEAMRALEWGHYFGLPSLIIRWMTGRWILVRTQWNLAIPEHIFNSFAQSVSHQRGVFTFFVARKV